MEGVTDRQPQFVREQRRLLAVASASALLERTPRVSASCDIELRPTMAAPYGRTLQVGKLAFNTIVNDCSGGDTFVCVRQGDVRAQLMDNLLVGCADVDVQVAAKQRGNPTVALTGFPGLTPLSPGAFQRLAS